MSVNTMHAQTHHVDPAVFAQAPPAAFEQTQFWPAPAVGLQPSVLGKKTLWPVGVVTVPPGVNSVPPTLQIPLLGTIATPARQESQAGFCEEYGGGELVGKL